MIHNKKEFSIGLALIVGFFLALVGIFSPIFPGGTNTLDYMDSTFNSISKDSAYYIPVVAEKARKYDGAAVTMNIKAADPGQAAHMEKMLTTAGAKVVVDGANLNISGDLGRMLGSILADADLMYKNEGAVVAGKYGFEEKRALYDWHRALSAMTKDLNKQSKFKEGKLLRDVQTKAVEPAYNYYGVKAVPMSKMIVVALAALIGYVVYTIWYGFAILFLFEGWGFKLEH
ncbi:MAG: hypothetical protein M0Q22_00485 [Sulfuritalea sp.]|jgi:hypothetical protein|nr:hypothetical protein [Sulfuritalea sp.]